MRPLTPKQNQYTALLNVKNHTFKLKHLAVTQLYDCGCLVHHPSRSIVLIQRMHITKMNTPTDTVKIIRSIRLSSECFGSGDAANQLHETLLQIGPADTEPARVNLKTEAGALLVCSFEMLFIFRFQLLNQ